MWILQYGCTTWTLTKCIEKKLDSNYTRMLGAILNTSWRQHPTKQQLYGYLPPITKTIQVRRTRHAGYCWRSRDELIRDVLLWTPSHGRAKAGRPARTYIQQLCANMGCNPEDLPEAMDDRGGWWERISMLMARRENIPSPLPRIGYNTKQFSIWVQLVWIQVFPSLRLVAKAKLKNPLCPPSSP